MTFDSISEVKRTGTATTVTAFACSGCQGGYFSEIHNMVSPSAHNVKVSIDGNPHYVVLAEYPEVKNRQAPEHVPENIQGFYVQSSNAFDSQGFDASSMMSRKVLEASVKHIHPNSSGSLYSRIEQLFKDGLITEQLKQWAHIIRDDGNDAAHDLAPVSREHAEELLEFSHLFLLYVFTMPGMIMSKKKNT
jgi:hypothetical protein